MRSLHETSRPGFRVLANLGKCLLLLPILALSHIPGATAQVLNPAQIFASGVACPADQPGAPNNFACTSNDIKLDLVQLTGLASCTEGQTVSAVFDVDLEVNANIRYNPMVWISQNAVDPRTSGSVCFTSSVPDGPLTHIPELLFADANQCADINVPSNNFTLTNLELGSVTFVCQDTDNDGRAEIPIIVTWNNSGGAACGPGQYPINQTPSKCDAFTAETDITVVQTPGIQLGKAGTLNDDDGTPGVSAGDTISYAFSVTNTGNVTLTNITLSDPSLTSVSGGPIASLAAGATDSGTFTGSYTITQADIDSGSFSNTATVDSDQNVTDTATFNQPLAQNPLISLTKAGTLNDDDGTPGVSAGDTISYVFTVTNTGNVTLTNIMVTDPVATVTGGPLASLAPGASDSSTFTGSYTLTQADVDAGTFTNTATVTSDEGPTDNDSDTQPLARNPALTLVKVASPQTYSAPSQLISYQFQFTNSGNVTLYPPYTVSDDISTDEACPPGPASLAPGESVTCTATHTTTQADVDAGSVTNVASGTAQDPDGQTVTSNNDSETVTVVLTGSLALVKTATPNTYDSVGDVISYSYLLTNGTNITLYAPYTITDDKSADESCPVTPASIAPGESVTCSASYTITQADLDAGSVTNVATGTAQDAAANGQTVTSNQDTETVTANRTGSLGLVKTASPQTYTVVGDVINYSYELTNNTNITLYPPYTVADDKSTDENCPGAPASLAPGASVVCTASYTITDADVLARSVTNVATGTAQDAAANGQTVTSNQDTETVNLILAGTLTLVKSATPQTYSTVGDVISYSYLLTNNTNSPLYPPYTIDDDKSIDENCPGTPATLAVGESVTCTATYTITQADLDAGSVTNVATGTAQDAAANGQTVTSNQDTETVNRVLTGSLSLVKTATPQTFSQVGDVISYSYLLTNGTNNTLYPPYTIDDDKSIDENCPGTPDSLAPGGGSVICTASYTIVQADVDAGSVTNVAIGTAQDAAANGNPVNSNPDSETVSVVLINLAKSAADPTYDVSTGRYTVIYTITASNGGAAAGSYNLTDTFSPAAGITLYSASLSYGGGETQTGTTPGPLPYTFTSGEADIVLNEGLAAGATETWVVTAVFDVDPTAITADARNCTVGSEVAGQGFYNSVSGVTNETDTSDNDACTNLPDASIDLSKTAGDASYDGSVFTVIYTVTANNLGDGPGYYDLADSILPGTGISVSQAQLTAYNAGTEDLQSGDLTGVLPYTFVSPATLVTGEALAGGRDESWTIVVQFAIDFDATDDTFLCSDVSGGSGTGFYNEISGSDSDPDLTNNSACSDPSGGDAMFLVTKDFSDDNMVPVRVTLTCNTGIPLVQSFDISESGPFNFVNFVVNSFTPGEMNCSVSESPVPDGYTESYVAPEGTGGVADSIGSDAEGCHFTGVVGGQFECQVTNTSGGVIVAVDKVWDVGIENGDAVALEADITIFCNAEMPEGSEVDDSGIWSYTEHVVGDQTVSTEVIPASPSSLCWATEAGVPSSVEVENECGDSEENAQMTVSVGEGDQCTITNTVFFEGIPTLSQYGLALLALLMLGIGMVGFRRFA